MMNKSVARITVTHIPIDDWGVDHWGTFAYAAHCSIYKHGFISVFKMRCDKAKHPDFVHSPFDTLQPTRLKSELLRDHDDWDCLDDICHAGLIKRTNDYGVQLNPKALFLYRWIHTNHRVVPDDFIKVYKML